MIREWASSGLAIQCEKRSFLARLPMLTSPRIQSFSQERSIMPSSIPKPGQSFGDVFPVYITNWHPENPLSPFHYTSRSGERVWWLCELCQYEWPATIETVAKSKKFKGCPCCNNRVFDPRRSVWALWPQYIPEWSSLNPLPPHEVMPGTGDLIHWVCENGHDWACRMFQRTREYKKPRSCFVCESLGFLAPHLIPEWHPCNLKTPFDYKLKSHKEAWWRCSVSDDHEWECSISYRTRPGRKNGCPFCAGLRIALSTCLATTHPHLVDEFDENNGGLTPYNTSYGMTRIVNWKCSVGHRWPAPIRNRTCGDETGCPVCSGRIATPESSFGAIYPEVIASFAQHRNGAYTPFNLRPASNIPVWWQCDTPGHPDWLTAVNNRIKGGNISQCPMCAKKGYLGNIERAKSARLYFVRPKGSGSSNGYIGITTKPVENRIRIHLESAFNRGSQATFHEEIRTIGNRYKFDDHFDVQTLCEVTTYDDKLALATHVEGWAIDYLRTISPYGYNDQQPTIHDDTEDRFGHILEQIREHPSLDDFSFNGDSVKNTQLSLF